MRRVPDLRRTTEEIPPWRGSRRSAPWRSRRRRCPRQTGTSSPFAFRDAGSRVRDSPADFVDSFLAVDRPKGSLLEDTPRGGEAEHRADERMRVDDRALRSGKATCRAREQSRCLHVHIAHVPVVDRFVAGAWGSELTRQEGCRRAAIRGIAQLPREALQHLAQELARIVAGATPPARPRQQRFHCASTIGSYATCDSQIESALATEVIANGGLIGARGASDGERGGCLHPACAKEPQSVSEEALTRASSALSSKIRARQGGGLHGECIQSIEFIVRLGTHPLSAGWIQIPRIPRTRPARCTTGRPIHSAAPSLFPALTRPRTPIAPRAESGSTTVSRSTSSAPCSPERS